MKNTFDLIILGAGGTGLAAAMYGARLGLKTLCLGHSHGSELPVGGVITTTNIVENYPGFIKLTGPELAEKLEKHARSYDKVTIKEEKVSSVLKKGKCFLIKTSKSSYTAKTILIATGTKWKKLPETVKGSREFENRGLAFCALCDAPLFKDKIVSVIGGSDSAAKDALLLSEHAKKVYVIARSSLHPEPINMDRIKANKKIEVILGTQVTEIKGKDFVESVVLDKPFKGKKELEMQGVFVAIGHVILSDLAKPLGVKINKKGEIITDKEAKTNIPGIFAAGDVADTPFKQLITGVAEGCISAHSAYEHITKEKVLAC
jgi:thioredoxin reductase (NADPH)